MRTNTAGQPMPLHGARRGQSRASNSRHRTWTPTWTRCPLTILGLLPEDMPAQIPSPPPPMTPAMPSIPSFGGGGCRAMPGGLCRADFRFPGRCRAPTTTVHRKTSTTRCWKSDDPEDQPFADKDGDEQTDHHDAEPMAVQPPTTGPTTVSLPNGETVTAANPQLAAAIKAAASGMPIADAFRQEGITIPPPGTAVSDPVDPSRLTPGDIGMFTDRHALALGQSRALLNGQIQHISTVNGPSFLGWEHPPGPVTAAAPDRTDPPAPTRPATAERPRERRVIRRPPAHQEETADGRPNPCGARTTCVKPPATTKRHRSICGPCRRRTRQFKRAWTRWVRSSASCGRPDANSSSNDACATSNRPTVTRKSPTT